MRSVRISAWVLAMLLTCSPLSALAVETDLLPIINTPKTTWLIFPTPPAQHMRRLRLWSMRPA